jgi:hypothetical protein
MIALADEDLVRIPAEGFALAAVAPAHDGAARAARAQREVLEMANLDHRRARLFGAHAVETTRLAVVVWSGHGRLSFEVSG